MTNVLTDLSDKGRKQNKKLRYEVLYYSTPHRENEEPQLVAKFRCWVEAKRYAAELMRTPDATEVLIRS